jgi:hypothetical protein
MPWTRLSALLLAAAGAFHLHRAFSLAVTTDEAFTAIAFASPPWLQILTTYDANHHILHSLLCKLSLSLFGWNALALRLPSLLACLLFLVIAHRLARRLFPESPIQLVLCAWLAFHPALYDWFSLARGYSLALAFLLAALYSLAGPLPSLPRASVFLGLSAASNFVFAIPAACVALAWTAARALDDRRIWTRLPDLAVPGAALALVITAIPLSRADGANFYYGAPSLLDSLHSLFGIPHLDFISYVLILAVPLTLAAALWLSRQDETLCFFALSLTFSLLAIAALHLAGIPYPYGRTGTYITLLWILSTLSLSAQLESSLSIRRLSSLVSSDKQLHMNEVGANNEVNTSSIPSNWLWKHIFLLSVRLQTVLSIRRSLPVGVSDKSFDKNWINYKNEYNRLTLVCNWLWALLMAPAALFIFSIPTGYTRPWQYDAGNRAVMDHLLQSGASSPVIAASPMLVPGLEFYRRRPASSTWPSVQPFDPASSPESAPAYLILRTDEAPAQPPAAYTPIWRHFTSGIILYHR